LTRQAKPSRATYSRFSQARLARGIVLNLADGALDDTVSTVIEEVRAIHPDRQIIFEHGFTGTVVADQPRIAQMTSNLITNAIIHGSESTRVTIVGRSSGEYIEIAFSNGGSPIAADQLDKLLLPFPRADGSPNPEGLGLGLYIAFQIAKAHSGTLSVTSCVTLVTQDVTRQAYYGLSSVIERRLPSMAVG